MKKKNKIILGATLALVLLVTLGIAVVVVAAVFAWNKLGIPESVEKMKRVKAEGIEFGKSTDQNGCMEKGFSLKSPPDRLDISNSSFVEGCLKSARSTPNFCDGVPFLLDRNWFENQCRIAGHNSDACMTTFIAKRNYCQMNSDK